MVWYEVGDFGVHKFFNTANRSQFGTKLEILLFMSFTCCVYEEGQTTAVISHRYIQMQRHFLEQKLTELGGPYSWI